MFQFEVASVTGFGVDAQHPTIESEVVLTVQQNGGNRGRITAHLTFDKDGKLTNVAETRGAKPGMRPVCQSTKLLDSDPIVRKMARQDILIMGRGCRGYLLEQRQKASPELQKAIDEIWQEILEEEK